MEPENTWSSPYLDLCSDNAVGSEIPRPLSHLPNIAPGVLICDREYGLCQTVCLLVSMDIYHLLGEFCTQVASGEAKTRLRPAQVVSRPQQVLVDWRWLDSSRQQSCMPICGVRMFEMNTEYFLFRQSPKVLTADRLPSRRCVGLSKVRSVPKPHLSPLDSTRP